MIPLGMLETLSVTPAMEAGVTDYVWEKDDIISLS
jgi:hypothetical protein